MLAQKLIALIPLTVSVFCLSKGEGTVAIILIPVGVYLLFTKKKYTM